MPFTPWGMFSITPFTHGNDEAAPVGARRRRRRRQVHPSRRRAPNGDLLVVWSPGPATTSNRPTTLPVLRRRPLSHPRRHAPCTSPTELVADQERPGYNEAWPRAVVPYARVHGVAEPVELPWLPNDGSVHAAAAAGHAVRAGRHQQRLQARELPRLVDAAWSDTVRRPRRLQHQRERPEQQLGHAGRDAGRYTNADIWAIRILAMEPNTHRSYGPHGGRAAARSSPATPTRSCASWARSRCASPTPAASPSSIRRATPTPASWPRSRPTRRSRSRPSTATAWSSTWRRPGTRCAPARCATTAAAATPTASCRSPFATDRRGAGPTTRSPISRKTTPLLTKRRPGQPGAAHGRTPALVPSTSSSSATSARCCSAAACPATPRHAPSPPAQLVLDDYDVPRDGLPGDYARLADDHGRAVGLTRRWFGHVPGGRPTPAATSACSRAAAAC